MNLQSVWRKLGVILAVAVLAVSSIALFPSPAAAASYEVKMGSDTGMLQYVPSNLTVKPGDTIKFVNNKLGPHNAVFEGDSAVAKALTKKNLSFAAGETTDVTVPKDAEKGTYKFFCEPHRGAGMSGSVTVE